MSAYHVRLTHSARKALRKYGRSRRIDPKVFNRMLTHLEQEKPLQAQYRDHKLGGEFEGFRECHLSFDMLVLYKQDEEQYLVTISDIGTHDELFG